MYSWKLAKNEHYDAVAKLFRDSELGIGRGYPDIHRRIHIPMLLKQLIVFYHDKKFCGFLTTGFLSEDSEKHMATTGITATDWNSGDNFWVVDFIVAPGSDGYKMLRMATKDLQVKKAKYFRHKHKEIREVRAV